MVQTSPGHPDQIENRLRTMRTAKGLSQGALAQSAGVSRQAICAIEANEYLPTTGVALQLARALDTSVEDLFRLASPGEIIEGEWVGAPLSRHRDATPTRVKVAHIGKRVIVRPVANLGGLLTFAVPADGLLVQGTYTRSDRAKRAPRVQVRLLRDRRVVEQEIVVAGCDPAVFLLGEYLNRRLHRASVISWMMGSTAAVSALKRGEVHVAGLHLVDPQSGEANLPYLRRHFQAGEVKVVTFATWQQGLLLRPGNPKGIRSVEDLARKDVSIVNREPGAGARMLLDQHLARMGTDGTRINGYGLIASSHLDVARLVAQGQVEAGIGVESVARLFDLSFIPLREERYDLVMPTSLLDAHERLGMFLDTLGSRPFRTEIEALGGYDTQQTGNIVAWQQAG